MVFIGHPDIISPDDRSFWRFETPAVARVLLALALVYQLALHCSTGGFSVLLPLRLDVDGLSIVLSIALRANT